MNHEKVSLRVYQCLNCGNTIDVTAPIDVDNKIIRKMEQEAGCRQCSSDMLQQMEETEIVEYDEIKYVRI